MAAAWYEIMKNGITIRFVIQPKASRSEVIGLHGEPPRLKVRVAAPPVDGAANEELLHFLKKKLGLTSAQLSIVRGETSKMKDVFCAGLTEAGVLALLPK